MRILAFRISTELPTTLPSWSDRGFRVAPARQLRAEFFRPAMKTRGGRVLSGEFECQVQGIHEFRHFDGLGEITVKSGLQALLDVARHGVCADGNDRDMCRHW